MPSRERQTCQKKPFFMCAITSLILLVGSLVFTVIFLTFSCHDVEKNGIQEMTHDPGDSMHDDCKSKPAVVVDQHVRHRHPNTNSCQARSDAEQKAEEPAHIYMQKKHSVAIFMYTNATPLPDNQDFKTFDRCSLYFDLNEAIQILKHSQVSCLSTYYQTETFLSQNISNKQIRFSTFIASSLSQNKHSPRGNTCFEIDTCFGAEVTHYSALKQNGQVLIPPYEVFSVAGIRTDTQWCKVVYTLRSNLNCVYDRDSDLLHPISALPVDGFLLIIIIGSIVTASILLILVIVKVLENRRQSVSSVHNGPYSSGVVI